MNIIDCVVLLSHPLPSDTLFVFRRPYGEPLERRVPARSAGLSRSRKVLFMISSAWCGGICIVSCNIDFFQFSVSHGGLFSLFFFYQLPLSSFVVCLHACIVFSVSLRRLLFFSGFEISHRRNSGAQKRDRGLPPCTGEKILWASYSAGTCFFRITSGTGGSRTCNASDRDGNSLHSVWRWLEVLCPQKLFSALGSAEGTFHWGFLFHMSDPWRMGSCFAGAFCFLSFLW